MTTPRLMVVSELAEYLHVHQGTIYRLIKRRKLPAIRVGSDWRFSVAQIDKWIADKSVTPE